MRTISTALIVKDEIGNLPLLLGDLVKFSDEVVVVDTGSTDGTLEWLTAHNYPGNPYNLTLCHFQWIQDFAAARNYSFEQCTKDWIFWCDADDRISETLINELLQWKSYDDDEHDAWVIPYLFSANVIVPRNRLLKRSHGPKWFGRCHEYVDLPNLNAGRFPDTALILHQRQHAHSDRNLNIFINKWLEADHFTPRDRYYFIQELGDNGYQRRAEIEALNCIKQLWHVDAWNAINRVLYKRWTTENVIVIQEGLDILTYFMRMGKMRGDMYYTLAMLHGRLEDKHHEYAYCMEALRTVVEGDETYLEDINKSKVLPAIYVYENTVDPELKEQVYNIIIYYSHSSDVARNYLITHDRDNNSRI